MQPPRASMVSIPKPGSCGAPIPLPGLRPSTGLFSSWGSARRGPPAGTTSNRDGSTRAGSARGMDRPVRVERGVCTATFLAGVEQAPTGRAGPTASGRIPSSACRSFSGQGSEQGGHSQGSCHAAGHGLPADHLPSADSGTTPSTPKTAYSLARATQCVEGTDGRTSRSEYRPEWRARR